MPDTIILMPLFRHFYADAMPMRAATLRWFVVARHGVYARRHVKVTVTSAYECHRHTLTPLMLMLLLFAIAYFHTTPLLRYAFR